MKVVSLWTARPIYFAHIADHPICVQVQKKQRAGLLDVSKDFIQDHINSGTINTIVLKSPNQEAKYFNGIAYER